MPPWIDEGVKEYCKRMPSQCEIVVKALPLPKRTKNPDIPRLMKQELVSIQAAIPANAHVIALCVEGKRISTHTLSEQLQVFHDDNQDIVFLIGGPDGLHEDAVLQANARWSLSDLTLPHPLVRVLLTEQLYRAWTLLIGHPYHR